MLKSTSRCLAFVAFVVFGPLTASAKPTKGKTQVELQVTPATAQVFIDDKPMGKAGTARVLDVTPGFHVVRLVNKRDEHEERIKLPPNQKTTYSFEFDEEPVPATEASPSPVPGDDSMGRRRNSNENQPPPSDGKP